MPKMVLRADSVTVETHEAEDWVPGFRPERELRTTVTIEHMGDRYQLEGRLGKVTHIPPPTRKVPWRERLSRAWFEFTTTEERTNG